MQNLYQVNIYLRILYFSEAHPGFLILIGDDGEFPVIYMEHGNSIDDKILSKLTASFSDNSVISDIMSTKRIASIETIESVLNITYNFMSPTQHSIKSGKFIGFNQRSIEIYRYMNDNIK